MPDPPSRPVENSRSALARAQQVILVGEDPLFIKQAEGCTITDVDGNQYIDYVGGAGAMILGHADERVVTAMSKAIGRGTRYGAPVEAETQLASAILSALPAMEMLRFADSADDVMRDALRLARAATARELIVRADGDGADRADGIISIPYNDLAAARNIFDKHPDKIACFAVEPISTSAGVIAPAAGYLIGLRELCDTRGALLLFDESVSGFRVGWGGAQVLFHVAPDITCLANVIGGGLPLSACATRRSIMERDKSGHPQTRPNPVALAGGIATLEILKEPGTYETLEERSAMLAKGLTAAAEDNKLPITINRVGSMMSVSFTSQADHRNRLKAFAGALLDNGVLVPIDPSEPWFVSLAHTEEAINKTIEAADAAFKQIAAPVS